MSRLPEEPLMGKIERVAHDGRGLLFQEGRAIFVEGALLGEEVRFKLFKLRRDYGEGYAVEVLKPHPERVEPPCSAYPVCGGCALQHLDPKAQIELKGELLKDQLRRIGKLEPPPFFPPITGPVWGYRRKARLGVRFVKKHGRVFVGFRQKRSPRIADLKTCLVLHPKVGEHIADLAVKIDRLSIREKLPQVEVAVGDHRAALVFRVLDPLTDEDLKQLCRFGQDFDFDIYLQPGGPESVSPIYPETPDRLYYELPFAIKLYFEPLDFTQVNAEINRKLISRVLELLDPQPGETVLDLFCGIGNFTLPLARKARHVVGVEGSPAAVIRAQENAKANRLENVEFHVTDLTQDLSPFPWVNCRYDKVLLDPARKGALEVMAWLPKWQPKRVVYVSCNPATLARDLGVLVHEHGYRLLGVGVIDMFPHTAHVESVALLEPP